MFAVLNNRIPQLPLHAADCELIIKLENFGLYLNLIKVFKLLNTVTYTVFMIEMFSTYIQLINQFISY